MTFYGYDPGVFPRPSHAPDEARIGRIIEEHRRLFVLAHENGTMEASITGKMMYSATGSVDYPAVGDWVLFVSNDESPAVILEILKRKSVLRRRENGRRQGEQVIAANMDTAFIVMAADRDFNLNRLERYLTIVYDGGIRPVVILNKSDCLTEDEKVSKPEILRINFPKLQVYLTSLVSGDGLHDLKSQLKPGRTFGFIGSSGAGKSSLINFFLETQRQAVSPISDSTAKGRHTTTYRELIELADGSLLVDTPGMREVGIASIGDGLDQAFDEITELANFCRFSDCSHTSEPGCAVKKAVESGKLDERKYRNFLALRREADHYQMDDYEKRRKNKALAKKLKEFKNYRKTRR